MPAIGETSAQIALRDPDTKLMLAVRDDEQGAFEELVARYQARLIGVLHHLIGNADEAEDLAQEVFLRVYGARKKYRAKCKFSTWLFTIANNLALNAIRTRKRRPSVPLSTGESGPVSGLQAEQLVQDSGSQPIVKVERKEMAEIIQHAIAGLNERQRMAVLLNKFEDMNYAEIAEVMELTVKAVKSLLCRARVNLRIALVDYVHMDDRSSNGTEE